MEKNERFFEFNKEIVFGEIGAILGSSLGAYLSFLISGNEKLIPTFTVVGSIIGSTTLYLSTKIYHKIKRKELSLKNIFHDLKFYTPVAAPLRIFLGYPILYFLTRYFVRNTNMGAFYAGALGEFLSFLVFLFLINMYRIILFRFFKKRI
ncbi:MAG: hypothetical protein Q7S06_01975 [Nanoarchaeota archaeon]|nr:hypothetical protein [Nanoarchaeota archaeon]